MLGLGALAYGGFSYFRNRNANSSDLTPIPIVTENSNRTSVATTPVTTGDVVVNKTLTAHDTVFTISTALQTDAFRRKQAGEGLKFVVLFLKPFDQPPTTDPLSWAANEFRLAYGTAPLVGPTELSISNRAGVDGGYVWFTVPDEARDFSLAVGSPTSPTTVALGF